MLMSQSMMQFEKSEADFQVLTYQALIDYNKIVPILIPLDKYKYLKSNTGFLSILVVVATHLCLYYDASAHLSLRVRLLHVKIINQDK